MGKRNTKFSEEKIQRWLAEGRGQGFGRDYKPWLTIRDVPSIGRAHRPRSHTVGRTHHLLSDLEFVHFLQFDMAGDAVDIREQYPLPRDVTRHLAAKLKYRHPRQPRTMCHIVMTTDLLITRAVDGVQVLEAYAVKPSSEVLKKRVLQKLHIESAYWESLGVRFAVLTEQHISNSLRKALQWLHPAVSLHAADQATKDAVKAGCRNLLLAMEDEYNRKQMLHKLCWHLDHEARVEDGVHLMAARHLLANRVLLTDLSQLEVWRTLVNQISINKRVKTSEWFDE